MDKHVISILTFGNRARATCSCSGTIGRERFGDSCVKTAKIDGEAHLAKTKLEPTLERFTGWEKSSLGYFAALETLSIEEDCPICRTSMNLEPGSLDEVQCPQGHLFTLQIEGDVAGLFPDRDYPIVHQAAGIEQQGYGFNIEEKPVVCPFDGASFSTGFAGLPQYLEDFVVNCEEGHEFVAYKDDVVVTLFFDNLDGPFETTSSYVAETSEVSVEALHSAAEGTDYFMPVWNGVTYRATYEAEVFTAKPHDWLSNYVVEDSQGNIVGEAKTAKSALKLLIRKADKTVR